MACPKCGCKETYSYVDEDILGLPDDQERCAACEAVIVAGVLVVVLGAWILAHHL